MRKSKLRKLWEDRYKLSLDGYELHHIIPIHMGGTNDLENLERVTIEEHKQRHLELYERHGNFRDLCAYYLLSGRFSEAQAIASSNGGKIGGKSAFLKKLGIFNPDYDRSIWASMGGKAGAKSQMQNRIGIHGQTPEERKRYAENGLKTQLDNGTNVFLDPKRQSEFGKRGGKKNIGFVWVNDGTKSFKYTKKQQMVLSIDEFLQENPHFKLGRILHKVECPYCLKCGNPGAMTLHHFNNCKHRNLKHENQMY